ncbi:MAG: signal peptidase [Rubrobacteraceae bacterium]|jgi:signal peptidase I|nr:signal peptidase [Rubrobacteraceae bacterium]
MTEKHFHEQGSEPDESSEESRGRRLPGKGGGFLEFLIILLLAFALVFGVVRPFVLEAFYIPSGSMVPTLKVGERVFVNKFIYRFSEPKRGDIIVFRSVDGADEDLIKRVVGLPGDEVAVQNGVLILNGEPQEEPYVNQRFPDDSFYGPTKVPEGKVFVMGDNRSNSADSRVFGPVPMENIAGEAFVAFWPPSRIGLL